MNNQTEGLPNQLYIYEIPYIGGVSYHAHTEIQPDAVYPYEVYYRDGK